MTHIRDTRSCTPRGWRAGRSRATTCATCRCGTSWRGSIPDWLARDPRLRELIAKGRGFAEADKLLLREIELELLRLVVPAYRAAGGRGQVELSCSPFYHPILPLLYDTRHGLAAHPDAARPRARFARPADARIQVERALSFHEQTFGRRPLGMWPSEGSVSDEAVT